MSLKSWGRFMNRLSMAQGIRLMIVAAAATAVGAEIPRIDSKQDTLQAVLDRIHEHAANDSWKQGGFTDEVIEKWLDKLVGSVAKAAGFPDLKLPVRLADVKPSQPQTAVGNLRGTFLTNALLVAKDTDLKTARLVHCVVLADGAVEVEAANGCVIVARGPVTIRSMSSHCVIVSGVYVKIARFDGEPTNTVNGSLIVSRSRAEIGDAYGSFIAAHDGVVVSSARDARFINMSVPGLLRPSPRPANPNSGGQKLQVPDFPLESFPRHAMAEKMEFVGIITTEAAVRPGFSRIRSESQTTGIVFRFAGRRYVAELGQQIVDEAGDAIEALRGWKLTLAMDKFAVFSRDTSDALVEFDAK